MAKLDRKDVKIFAENSKETLITEFRTEDSEGNTASFSRDPDVIQNENYSQGWVNDTNNLNTKIYGEDLNAVNYVLSYLLKYLYENGIAEWKSTTTYYQNSICKVDNALYLSLQNNNIGNDPTSTVSYWKLIPLENVSIEDAGSGFSIVKDVTDNVITFKTISVTGYGEITDNGDQLNIDIAGGGGGGGGDTYWGTIRGTITNQTDLISLINLKQDIFTVDSPLVLTDEQHLTINKATSSVSGYLDYNDFNTFNGKQDTISATLPISITNDNIEIETADTSTTGVLSYTDWNTFNNKQNAINGLTITETSTTFDVVPKSSITTSNIGSSSYPFSNSYINNTISNTVTTDLINAKTTTVPDPNTSWIKEKSVVINNVEIKEFMDTGSGFYSVDISSTLPINSLNSATLGYYRKFDSINVDTLQASGSNISVESSLIPSTDNTYNLGSSTNAFNTLYVNNLSLTSSGEGNANKIKTSRLQVTDGTNGVEIGYTQIIPLTSANLGNSSNRFNDGWVSHINTEQLVAMIGGVKLNLGYNYMSPETADQYQLGYQSRFLYVYSAHFDQGSDIKNKSNIKDYEESVLEKIKNITPITYNYKNEERKTLGLSAQELKEIEPLIVSTQIKETKSGKEEELGIDLYSLNAFALKAIKELNAKVEALEARVNELEGNKKELEK